MTPTKPNVLFIVTDDQRPDTIRALGNAQINTPNLDELVRTGFAFDRNFCTTPICTPARAELLTGCDSFRNRVPYFALPIDPELTLLPKAFQDAGFHTIHVGKWHNDGHPRDKSYDRVRRVFGADNKNTYHKNGHWVRFSEESGEVEGHTTELFTDAAIEEIDAAPSDKPWFCFLAYHAPHDPHHSPPPFDTMYEAASMPLLPNYMPEHPIDNGAMTFCDELHENWPRTQDAMRRYRARYYGIISHLDHHLGRVLARLRQTGQMENTLIVYVGDQGLAIGSHGLLGKENMYDHSIAGPLILSGPGIVPGGRSRALSHHTDLFPTVCELAGVPLPPSASGGHSLMPLIRGEQARVRDAVLCEFCVPDIDERLTQVQRAVRTERWKLIWNANPGLYQLFDLERDADELVNLLAPWRTQLRAFQAGEKVPAYVIKIPSAAIDLQPPYKEKDVRETALFLWRRMLELMREKGDPILETAAPPCPFPHVEGNTQHSAS